MTRLQRSAPETGSHSSRDPTLLWLSHMRRAPTRPPPSSPPTTARKRSTSNARLVLPHVAGVSKRVRAGLRPYQQAVGTCVDLDSPDQRPCRRVEDVDLTVVSTREPQLRAVGADATHVR